MNAADANSMTSRSIDVLVVDDSRVAQALLVHILEADDRIRVAGVVESGQAAVDFVQRSAPDVIVMDIYMPGMDGFEATRRIMEMHPVPIVICTATADPKEVATTFRAMEAGALACLQKPHGPEHPEFDTLAAELRATVKTMSEVKLVRRWARSAVGTPTRSHGARRDGAPNGQVRVVGIGASTGGPQVLQEILAALPKDFPVPILVVQHIAHGFLGGLAQWLNETTGLRVHIGGHGMAALPGHAYLAPDDYHMGLRRGEYIVLTKEPEQYHLRPAVSYLFRSLAAVYGSAAIGVLLTGMGRDGAAELKLMKDSGAITIAQDGQSAIVNGMPGEAVRLGGATLVLPGDQIAASLMSLVARKGGTGGGA